MSGFNAKAFMSANLALREEVIKLPALADWFDGEPEITVRGLTAPEFAKAQEASVKHKTLGAFTAAIGTQLSDKEMKKVLDESLGISDDPEPEVVKRLEMLVAGCVKPEMTLDVAVKLSNLFTIEFYQLTNAITKLTGMGAEAVKKRKPSGKRLK